MQSAPVQLPPSPWACWPSWETAPGAAGRSLAALLGVVDRLAIRARRRSLAASLGLLCCRRAVILRSITYCALYVQQLFSYFCHIIVNRYSMLCTI